MKHFINLTSRVINKLHIIRSRVINKLHIIRIEKEPSKYTLYLAHKNIDGWMFCGSGSVVTSSNNIEICEKKDKEDYDKITEIINKIK